MNRFITPHCKSILNPALRLVLLITTLLSLAAGSSRADGRDDDTPQVFPPQAHPYGRSYAEWSAAWWQWAFALPVAGHPFNDSPDFDVTAGQSGHVWFLAGTFGTVKRHVTIPAGKALFIAVANAEASSLEDPPFYGATAAAQQAIAIAMADPFERIACIIDGQTVRNIGHYRFVSPQFAFIAPTPWIFGATGGIGTSVGDGYYVMLAPMSAGKHTIHFHAALRFGPAAGDVYPLDVTYVITAKGGRDSHDRDDDRDDRH